MPAQLSRSSTWREKQDVTRHTIAAIKNKKALLVDEDEQKDWSKWRQLSARLITSPKFDAFIAMIVVANSITMGLESEITSWREFFVVTDAIFLVIYTVELSLRTHVSGLRLFRMAANILDLVIVVAGWASLTVDLLGSDAESLRMITTLKVLRAFRSIRLLRMFTFFEGCWIIAASFFSCLKPLFWTCVFLSIILFTFTMFAIELIGKSEAFDGVPEQEDFKSTHLAFFTLFQITTLDEWRYVVQPLCSRQGWAYFFFAVYLAMTAMSLMNLVTAVVVDSSMKRTLNEEEYKRSKERRQRALESEDIKQFMMDLEEEQEKSGDAVSQRMMRNSDQTGRPSSRELRVSSTTDMVTTLTSQSNRKRLGGSEILGASSKWRGIEKIFDAFCIQDPTDVNEIITSMDEDGDGDISVSEYLDGLLDLRTITEDKHRLALIQACDTSVARCEIVSRCLRDVRAPEDCVKTLRKLEDQLGNSNRRHSHTSDGSGEPPLDSPLTQAINKEIDLLQSELKKQRSKVSKQKRDLTNLRDAVFELQQNLAFQEQSYFDASCPGGLRDSANSASQTSGLAQQGALLVGQVGPG
mmetsp:Transcript_155747/g.283250  ORF Transcript_155747/g.283250 Transcript_155747/m.283250 type:complete len:582 (+) Transcript_155747:168-1913(+)